MDKEEIIEILRRLAERIENDYKAEIIGLFGSYSRGEQSEDSDVDVLVRFGEGATLLDFMGLANFLEDELNLKVDIVSERAIREELKDQILKEVVTI